MENNKKKLVLIHTVNWYAKVINIPFGESFLKQNPHVEIINIMDDSLLTESLPNGGPTKNVIRRMLNYFMAAEAIGADVIMSTCTTMGKATETARNFINVPLFNIDEPMAIDAISAGKNLGIIATVPTSAPATQKLLEAEALKKGKDINITTIINQKAFEFLLAGETQKHNELVHKEMEKLQNEVDAIVFGQISLAQINYDVKVPVFQVGHSGFAHAAKLLEQ